MGNRIATSCLVVLLAVVLGACQDPSGSASPASTEPAGATPVAPAIQPEPSGPETPIASLPPGEPVAPAIQPEPSGPETPLGTLPPDGEIAPAVQAEPTGPDPTVEFGSGY